MTQVSLEKQQQQQKPHNQKKPHGMILMDAVTADQTINPEGQMQVKFFIHFNYSLHKMKVRLISSVHKTLIRSGIFAEDQGLSLQGAD